ncbi:HK97 family phage prohead protease [Pseudochelatococcus lubricantis]|uniref:HK97 family phage prohead protease n=1 Tax=Pseudochelatococcus lubricantis TaxID=1538102 RepID=UPI0035ED7D9D
MEEHLVTGHLAGGLRLAGRLPELKAVPSVIGPVDGEGVFEGYASLFNVPDLGGDIIEPGAFAASLARRGAAGVRLLWQHDPGEPLGTWLSLVEDARGLKVRGRLSLDARRARDVEALLKTGAVDGLSIGFHTERARREASGVRRISRLDLWEVSIVTFPMAPGARVLAAAPATKGNPPLAEAIRRVTAELHS